MATITLSLSRKSDKATRNNEVLIEFWHGRAIHQRAKTNLYVHPDYWNSEQQTIVIPNWRLLTKEKKQIKDDLIQKKTRLNEICELVQNSFQSVDKSNIAKDWLKSLIYDFNFPKEVVEDSIADKESFFDAFEKYVTICKFSDGRKRKMRCVIRTLQRFELYTGIELEFDTITDDTLREIEEFYFDEPAICQNECYTDILKAVPESRTPQPRGGNTLNAFMKLLKAFINWAIKNEYTTNYPFKKYTIPGSVYGTPIFINKDELERLYHFDFSNHPKLARQRDIFVFHCMIGCRISDLWAMTNSNIVDGILEYIPSKTMRERGDTIRVPLNEIAREILERYKDENRNSLLPFISQQHYNNYIKTILQKAGIDRIVTKINPITQKEEQRPIYEVASSHMARRTFIGNLYNKVKDPNIIGKFTGHTEGSKAFCRYRDIDIDMGKDLVKLLDF